eukprot:scaffold1639_cov331-Pavlova_lutheri.AAC.2
MGAVHTSRIFSWPPRARCCMDMARYMVCAKFTSNAGVHGTGSSAPSNPVSPCTSAHVFECLRSGRADPATTGTSGVPQASSTLLAL